MPAFSIMGWSIDLEGGRAESDDASVEFTTVDGRVRVHLVRPKVADVNECWAARTAGAAEDAIAMAAAAPADPNLQGPGAGDP